MAARVHPQDVSSAHQSMHHLVADAQWSDEAVLAAVAQQVVPSWPSTMKAAGGFWMTPGMRRKAGIRWASRASTAGVWARRRTVRWP